MVIMVKWGVLFEVRTALLNITYYAFRRASVSRGLTTLSLGSTTIIISKVLYVLEYGEADLSCQSNSLSTPPYTFSLQNMDNL
jgi:hypothetical protein